MELCKKCKKDFDPKSNKTNSECCHHPGFFAGETKQRWSEPGDDKNGGEMHFFWSCCGSSDSKARGCAFGKHEGF